MSDKPKDEPMNQAQLDAIQKAWDILTEHFDRVLLVADWECDTPDEDGQNSDGHCCYWHGGALSAVGMAQYGANRILQSGRRFAEPE